MSRRPFRFFWEDDSWSPWDEFDRFSGGSLSGVPVDVVESEESITVEANLPGFDKKNVSIRVMENRLVIDAEQSGEEREVKENYFRQERICDKVHREIALPEEIEEDKAEARMDNGVLVVELPKKEKTKKKGKELKIS